MDRTVCQRVGSSRMTETMRCPRIPSDATCLRSLGCQGGLTFEEFPTLSDAARKRRAAGRSPCQYTTGCAPVDAGKFTVSREPALLS